MNKYYISFSNLESVSLLNAKIIEGKTATEALKKHYDKKFKRDADRQCDVVMSKCRIENDKIVRYGNTSGYSVIR